MTESLRGYKLVKLDKLSGPCCSIYSVANLNNEQKTLLDKFIDENIDLHKSETKELISRLHAIGHQTGARSQYFKLYEGTPGDGVCALYDMKESNLRLYCIRYGTLIVVVGGGGHKPKTIRTFQEDNKLREENIFTRII